LFYGKVRDRSSHADDERNLLRQSLNRVQSWLTSVN